MNYPSINEYIEAIRFAEDNFDQLKHLRPVLGGDGKPVMTSGNFAVVFQMKDEQTGKLHAVKCFLREQEGRAEAYRQIAEELEYVSSTFLTPIKYLDKELFVDTNAGDEKEFPVLLMDWVESQTLDKYIREHIDDQYELSLLAYQFSRLAMWLMPQPFAHGDLKPDNILVKEDGTLVLVDYDGMYVPAMKGQRARELGSPDFRHPSRTETDFDEHIDDFSLASILLSLKAISLQPSLLEEHGAQDRLLFSANDYRNLSESKVMDELKSLMQNAELASLYSLFILAASQNNLSQVSFRLFNLNRPKEYEMTDEEFDAWYSKMEEDYYKYNEETPLLEFARKNGKMSIGELINPETSEPYKCCMFTKPNGDRIFVYFSKKLGVLSPKEIIAQKESLYVAKQGLGYHFLCGQDEVMVLNDIITEVTDDDWNNVWIDEYGVKYSHNKTRLLLIPTYIKDYKIRTGTRIISDSAFGMNDYSNINKSSLNSIYIPTSVRIISSRCLYGCQHLSHIIVDDNNPVFDSRGNCNAIIKTKNNELLLGCKTTLIPQDIFIISSFAFHSCCYLQSINIPESVTEIGEYAFGDCIDLKKIHIPSSIKKIGIGAFSGCGLEQITVDNNNPLFDSRDDCNAIISKDDNRLIIGCKNTIIPLTVTTIGSFAFESCEIEEITIPNNIIKIEDFAFSNCSKLEIIYIPKGERSKFEKLLPEFKDKLEEIYQDEKDYLTDFELPDGSIYNGECVVKPFGSVELCGLGEVVYNNGDKYKGEFKYGRPLGWGKYWFRNGYTHKGFFDEKPMGIGYLNEDFGMAVGFFFGGLLNGWGICYRDRIFKFGYWEHGVLTKDFTKETLWIRHEITSHRVEYKGNLIQIGKEHDFIRLGIPQKLLETPTPDIPTSIIPKIPAWGFEFFKDGTAKVGFIKDHTSGEYMLCKKDGNVETGKWKDNLKTFDISSFDTSNMEVLYEEDGLDVYKK